MLLSPLSSESLETAVTSTQAEFAGSSMASGQFYQLVSTTNAWWLQANPTATITCDANSGMADGDTVTITDGINAAFIYEYDKSSNGVTGGHIAWAAGTTAATVANNLATAIKANQTKVTVANNGAGVLTLTATVGNLVTTKSSSSAMTVAYTPQATAGAGSAFLPLGVIVALDGAVGSSCSIIRDTADGKASLTRCKRF